MKTTDMRFEKSIFKGFIGTEFEKYKCDPFTFTNSVTQTVGLYIDKKIFNLTNIQESVDYFGANEDVAVCRISEVNEDEIHSAFVGQKQIEMPVLDKIAKIQIINEHQTISDHGQLTYEVWLTRAIIFKMGEREISFEKDTVPFSEEIIIRKGYNLITMLTDKNSFYEGWKDGIQPNCEREIVNLE